MTQIFKIPCISNKCILLPVCKAKSDIECKNLTQYYGDKTNRKFHSGDKVWIDINKILPNLERIQGPLVHRGNLIYRTYMIHKDPHGLMNYTEDLSNDKTNIKIS